LKRTLIGERNAIKKQKLFLKGHKGKDGRVQTTLERELVIAFMRKRNWKERKKKKLANRQTDRRWASLQKNVGVFVREESAIERQRKW
jgi:hypothetical protein